MARLFDRVKETTTTTGTGDITLAGAASAHRAFSSVYSVGDEQIPYLIVGQTGTEWEVGNGTYSSSNTLRRDEVLSSSNSDALVNFSSGTKDVMVVNHAVEMKDTGRRLVVAQGTYLP